MKITELITALEDYKQLVQDIIDPLVKLVTVNTSLGLTAPTAAIALPPPAVAALPAAQLHEKSVRLKRAPKTAKKLGGVARGRTKKSGGERSCSTHPGNTEWDTNGGCSPCRREYQNKRRIEKGMKPRVVKSERPVAEMRVPSTPESTRSQTAPTPIRRRAPVEFSGDELEYSKPITCPKCHSLAVRFSRPEEFNRDTDSWTCLKNGCQVRIAHIVLAVDRGYEPDAA